MKISHCAFSLAAVVISGDLALAAPVAILSGSTGQVSVQTSKGIVPAKAGTQLSEGDRLAVGRGSATVSYLKGKCKGGHEIGPQSIAVISVAGDQCSKRIEGAKAQSLDPNVPDYIPAGLVIIGGGALAAGLALTNGGDDNNAVFPLLPAISP